MWIPRRFKHCPTCGAPVEYRIPADDNRERATCTVCATIHYENPINVVGTLPVGLDDAQRSSAQILGGLVVLANDDRGRRVAREWEEHASLDGGILLRDPTDASEAGSRLRAHRHDQSVLSCLLKSHRLPSEPDETFYAPRWETDGADSPFWAMRNRSGVAYRRGSRYFWALRAAEKGTLAAQATASGLLRRRPGRFGDSIGERSH
mgnify:CR=1 FL=1